MTEKFNIHLEGVPQTLLMPLIGRANFSLKSYSPIHDELAIQLVKKFNYNFDDMSKKLGSTELFFMARAFHFDEAIKEFLLKHPDGTIVNLGAGLDTTFYRIDNHRLTWFDLDLPEVISLREKLLPPSNRVHPIAKSILDYSWMDEIKSSDEEILFFAGGLFMYFSETQVKELMIAMSKRFPKSQLIFDTISVKGMFYANKMLDESKMKGAVMHWAIDDVSLLAAWSSTFKIVHQTQFFKAIKALPGFPFMLRLKMYLFDYVNKAGIIRLKFCS